MAISRRVLARHIANELYRGARRSDVVLQLAAYVVEHKLTSSIELIVADVARNLEQRGMVSARVVTARVMSEDLRRAVENYVKRIEGASVVELDQTVDASLIGGIVIEAPNKRLDATIATTLKNLRSA